MEHTTYHRHGDEIHIQVKNDAGAVIDHSCIAVANEVRPRWVEHADFIVLACNAHKDLTQQRDDLLAACEKILPQIYRAHGDYQEARYIDTEELEAAIASAG